MFVSSRPQKTAVLLDTNPISKILIKNKLQKEGYKVLENLEMDQALTNSKPDILLFHLFSEPSAAYQQFLQSAKLNNINRIGYRMQGDANRKLPLSQEVDREIVLDKTASNLFDSLFSTIH
jgi:hypothetical protein